MRAWLGIALASFLSAGCITVTNPFAHKDEEHLDRPKSGPTGGPTPPWGGPAPTPTGPGAGPGAGTGAFPGAGGPGAHGAVPTGGGGYSEQIAYWTQRATALEEDKKTFGARMAQLEMQLRDKDRALVQASHELEDATAQVARTREDLARWKEDMEKTRAKLRAMEKDSKVTLETIIRTLEEYFERNGEVRRPIDLDTLLAPRRKDE
ncbi:MAG: hypothetical protein U0793_13400 [Gemmataceae bacterium]